jgi:hypothetical protein
MLDEQFQDQCRQFRSFSKQSERFTCLKEENLVEVDVHVQHFVRVYHYVLRVHH